MILNHVSYVKHHLLKNINIGSLNFPETYFYLIPLSYHMWTNSFLPPSENQSLWNGYSPFFINWAIRKGERNFLHNEIEETLNMLI